MGRILRVLFFLVLAALIVNRLFNRQQKRALHEVVQLSAWVILAGALLALIWYAWRAYSG